MDRQAARGIISGRPVQTLGRFTLRLLLQNRSRQGIGTAADAPCRRGLYGQTVFGLAQDCSGAKEGRLRCQSQAHPANHAALGFGGQSTWTQHLETASGAYQISLSVRQCSAIGATGCLEHRHHLYPPAKRVCLSCRCDRLVQSARAVLSPFQQLGDALLRGCFRRGNRTPWTAKNFQYRSRRAIYLKGVRSGGNWPRYSLQHGRPGARLGQRVCGAAVEISEV